MAGKYDFFVFKILCDISKGAEYQNFLVERLAVKSGLDKDGLAILSEDDEGYDPDLFYYSPWVKS